MAQMREIEVKEEFAEFLSRGDCHCSVGGKL